MTAKLSEQNYRAKIAEDPVSRDTVKLQLKVLSNSGNLYISQRRTLLRGLGQEVKDSRSKVKLACQNREGDTRVSLGQPKTEPRRSISIQTWRTPWGWTVPRGQDRQEARK